MKLINLNIAIRIDNADKVARFLKEQHADIICLQEVCRIFDTSAKKKYHSQRVLDKALKETHPYTFFSPMWVSESVREADKIVAEFGGLIESGQYIMSKYPITFASSDFVHKSYIYPMRFLEGDHGRCLQRAIILYKKKKLQIGNIHGHWTKDKMGDKKCEKQNQMIVEILQSENIPTILVGDVNLLPNAPSMKILNKHFRNIVSEYEITSTRPKFDDGLDSGGVVVDYVLTEGDIEVNDCYTIETDISDHYPLVLEFTF